METIIHRHLWDHRDGTSQSCLFISGWQFCSLVAIYTNTLLAFIPFEVSGSLPQGSSLAPCHPHKHLPPFFLEVTSSQPRGSNHPGLQCRYVAVKVCSLVSTWLPVSHYQVSLTEPMWMSIFSWAKSIKTETLNSLSCSPINTFPSTESISLRISWKYLLWHTPVLSRFIKFSLASYCFFPYCLFIVFILQNAFSFSLSSWASLHLCPSTPFHIMPGIQQMFSSLWHHLPQNFICCLFGAKPGCVQGLLLSMLKDYSRQAYWSIWYAGDRTSVSHVQGSALHTVLSF